MWPLYALTASLLQAGMRITNQHLKLPGLPLTRGIKLFQIAYTFPVLFFIDWPGDPVFYALAILTAPLVVYTDKSLFDFTARYGAGAVTRIEPLSVPAAFIGWIALNPALIAAHVAAPGRFAAIALCILVIAACAVKLRGSPVSRDTLAAMVPVILLTAALNIVAKFSIDHAPDLEGIAVFIFLQSLSVVSLSWLFDSRRKGKGYRLLKDAAVLKAALALSAVQLCVIVLRLSGYILAANPAYVTALMLLGPFWVLLYYRLIRHEERGSVWPGVFIVLAAIALSLLAL